MRNIEFKTSTIEMSVTSVINVISVINRKLFSHEAVSVSYCRRTLAKLAYSERRICNTWRTYINTDEKRVMIECAAHLCGSIQLKDAASISTSQKPIYFSPHLCYYFNNQYKWQTRETRPFPKVNREEAPAAASASTSKNWIPLASLYL